MHFKKLISEICILFLFFSCEINDTPLASEAQKQTWVHLGLDSTSVNVLQMDGNSILYVSVWGKGIYRYVSGNQTWEQKNKGLQNDRIQDFLISKDNYFYACSHSLTGKPGIYKSVDGGDNWEHVGLENSLLWCLAEDSYGNIYAGSLSEMGLSNYIHQSKDGGDNWLGLGNPQYFPPGASQIQIDSKNNIFVSGENSGIYMQKSGDTTWTCIGFEDYFVKQILLNSTDELFCYCLNPTLSPDDFGLFFSSDLGQTWIECTNSFPYVKPDYMVSDSKGVFYAFCRNVGLYSSDDNGINWMKRLNTIDDNSVEYLYFGPDGYLYAGTVGRGVWRSREAL